MQKLPLFLRLLLRRSRKGPPARYDVRRHRAVPVPAADGVSLMTDHYAPVTADRVPTILMRAPYIRTGFPWNYLYGALFAEQGFHVLMQSSRGTGGSGGEFHFSRNEAPDGQATVGWLREQDWFTGELYTLGPSYNAYSQFTLAADPPPEWHGAIMQVGQTNPHGFFWPGGAFALERSLVGGLALFGQTMTAWDLGLAVLRLRRKLQHVLRAVPLFEVYPSAFGGRRPAFEGWLSSPDPDDPEWKGADLRDLADTFTVPSSLSTGWWDLVPEQVIEQFQRLRAAGCDADLLIGPWTHTDSLEKGWAELFAQAMRRMRGEPPAYRVRAHIGGVDEWRDLEHWPPPEAREQRWHLGDGALCDEPGPGATTFRYDPADPTPSIGGALQSPTQGQRDNAELEKRADVVLFTGPALTEAIEVLGPVRAEFTASTTAACGDLFARLCDVDPDGRSVNVCDGLAQIAPDGRTVVEMAHAGHRFRPGHRLRLLVAGGAHPRYLRNYGTGEPPGPATTMVATETTVTYDSTLVLSVV